MEGEGRGEKAGAEWQVRVETCSSDTKVDEERSLAESNVIPIVTRRVLLRPHTACHSHQQVIGKSSVWELWGHQGRRKFLLFMPKRDL